MSHSIGRSYFLSAGRPALVRARLPVEPRVRFSRTGLPGLLASRAGKSGTSSGMRPSTRAPATTTRSRTRSGTTAKGTRGRTDCSELLTILRVHEEPQSHRPAADEAKSLMPHAGRLFFPLEQRVVVQPNPLLHVLEVREVLRPQIVDCLQ